MGSLVGALATLLYLALRFLGKTRGAGMVRGLGMVVVGLFLLAQVISNLALNTAAHAYPGKGGGPLQWEHFKQDFDWLVIDPRHPFVYLLRRRVSAER